MNQLSTVNDWVANRPGHGVRQQNITANNGAVTTTRKITDFMAIVLEMNAKVYYSQEPAWKIELVAAENIQDILETVQVDNRLIIKYRDGSRQDEDESISIYISGPGINRFEVIGAGTIYGMNTIQSSILYLSTIGSGDICLQQISTGTVEAVSKGSGYISSTGGNATNGTFKTGLSGSIDFSRVTIKNISTHICGSGDVKLKVTDRLVAGISGSGSIYYCGSPFIVSDISGNGRLIHY
jgi:hypothetical protein